MDGGTPAQQQRGIVLHRPARRELLQLPDRRPGSGHRLPAREISDGQQMVGTSLLTCPVAGQHTRGSTFNLAPSRAPATGGAALTSSSTNPSHGNVHSWTAKPKPCAGPLARREATNSTSAGVNVKNLIGWSCPMSGNPQLIARNALHRHPLASFWAMGTPHSGR
jgi:hypothetical protein